MVKVLPRPRRIDFDTPRTEFVYDWLRVMGDGLKQERDLIRVSDGARPQKLLNQVCNRRRTSN
jgi:hypothetical protein